MMAYWLFKSEPGAWSWAQQSARPFRPAEWSGVRSHTAKRNMLAMQVGELAFFYHSMEEKSIVGIVRIAAAAHPDSTDPTGVWSCVDIIAEAGMPRPVTLAQVKAEPSLSTMALVRQSRLSVQPVTPAEWHSLCRMGDLHIEA